MTGTACSLAEPPGRVRMLDVGVLLGVLVAIGYGSGDFLGGLASRRSPAGSVVLIVQVVGTLGIAVVLVLSGTGPPGAADLTRGVVAGVGGAAGLALLYRALASGDAGVVAPTAALSSALVPVGWGLLHGERPSTFGWAGVVLALAAAVLVSGVGRSSTAGVPSAALAGLLLGSTLVLFAGTSHGSGLWPVACARLSAAVTVVVALAVTRRLRLLPVPAATRLCAAGAGVLDVTGSALLQIAVRHGLLTVVAPVTALAPAATVVLSRLFLNQRLDRTRVVGLALAVGGVALLAAA